MNDRTDLKRSVSAAAQCIADADAMVITAGAGMGVDSGLPDFRGREGFWRAYPEMKELGLDFYEIANPASFSDNPELAWAFYGHRQALYLDTAPHPGFGQLLQWCESMPAGHFVFTSNVDDQFQRSGFSAERMFEVHGSVFALQCLGPCTSRTWRIEDAVVSKQALPTCPECGRMARPNVLMFSDFGWIGDTSERQAAAYDDWLAGVADRNIVVVEIGAGKAIPTVRLESERLMRMLGATLIRINPRDADVPDGAISIPLGGLDGLRRIREALEK